MALLRRAKRSREAVGPVEEECPGRRTAHSPKEAMAHADPKEPGLDEARRGRERME